MQAWFCLGKSWYLGILLLQVLHAARGGGLEFSDPANLPPPPQHAIGFPSRGANFDVLPGFVQPPPGYGEVAFFWWLGDPLTKERLTYHLDRLSNKGVMGLQVNYAHSDKGGRSYGLTYRSEPPLFSEAWWKLFQWFVSECRKRGMAASLSDYTLCAPGQGWFTDEIIRDYPALAGSLLRPATKDVGGRQKVSWDVPEGTLSLVAFRMRDGAVEAGSGVDLRTRIKDGKLSWDVPAGNWKLVAVSRQKVPLSIDPMNPSSGKRYIEKFFQRFEDHSPGEGGKGLNFFFSDELDLGIGGTMWTDLFADEFRKRKGYDLLPELAALFMDIGPRTPKVRLDYGDVLVSLSEENFFRPVFEWHYHRGMIYGCDHGGRGENVVEFGDYFRTQRWMTGPGNDSPGFGNPDIIKNKVNASIAHLYQRPRVWLEGYHSSGWSSSTEGLVATHMKNYAAGSTLLTLHGLYYSTHGGFWEWAPPCNHWRMPYWEHMGEYLHFSERLSYLLSQGVHRCDVAVLYPVAPLEAGMRGSEAVEAAFSAGRQLFAKGLDFDFIDFESLARARVEEKELRVSGEAYRVLVLPAMAAARHSTLQKALEFYRGGGVVMALKTLPEASDRAGREDSEVDGMVKEIFGVTAAEGANGAAAGIQRSTQGGVGIALLGNTGSRAPKFFDGGFEGRWVWAKEVQPKVYFKAVWPGAPGSRRTYKMKLLCDNSAVLFINGKETVRCNDYLTGWTGDVQLTGGDVITIDAFDQDNGNHSAGLFVALLEQGKTKLSAEQFRYSLEDPKGDWRTSTQMSGLRKADPGNVHPFHLGARPASAEGLTEVIAKHVERDFVSADAPVNVLHRKIGPREVYLVYGVAKNADCTFRAKGKVELWDPWTGKTTPLFAVSENSGKTRIRMPLSSTEAQIIVFNPGEQEFALEQTDLDEVAGISERDGQVVIQGFAKSSGAKTARVRHGEKTITVRGQVTMQPTKIPMDGLWDFELKPTLDNRWGDFRMPASEGFIGPEARFFRYTDEPSPGWATSKIPKWKRVSCSFGPRFWKLGPLPHKVDMSGLEKSLTSLQKVDPKQPVEIDGQSYSWKPYEFSMRWGPEGDPGHQGYHGLKEQVSDDFIVLGRTRGGMTQNSYEPEAPGTRYYLWSTLLSDREGDARLYVGGNKPKFVAVNGEQVSEVPGAVRLKRGANPVLLRYDTIGRGHFIAEYIDAPKPAEKYPLAMSWYNRPGVVPFDIRGEQEPPVGWYHFISPPGLRGMTIVARGEVEASVNGKPVKLEPGNRRTEGREYRAKLGMAEILPAEVVLQIKPERGCYGGAALPEPVLLDCGPGQITQGDWSKMGAMEAYSGGAYYRKKVTLPPEQIHGKVVLELGGVVASAEVRVNGKRMGIRLAPPWNVEITEAVQPGENQIEILVYNTLANHYSSIPTHYRGSAISGLLGPVRIETLAKVELK